MKILGLITARGGSKGIPGKNIKPLGGKPLIAHTIEAAKSSGVFSRLVVSTDDMAIASVSREYGAEVPFTRPAELAQDKTASLPVLAHAVTWLREQQGFFPEITVLMQPTAPLLQPFHVREAVDLLSTSGADSVVGVSDVPGHCNPHWQFRVSEGGKMSVFTGEPFRDLIKQRQDLPKTYTRNGAIYAFRTELLFAPEPSFYGTDVRAYIMDAKYGVNIDSMEDFVIAEYRLAQLGS